MKKTMTKGLIFLFCMTSALALHAQSTEGDPATPGAVTVSTVPVSTTTTLASGMTQTTIPGPSLTPVQTVVPAAIPTPGLSQTPILPASVDTMDGSGSSAHIVDVRVLESTLADLARQRRVGWPDEAKPWENYDDFMKRLASEESEAIARLGRKIFTVGAPQVKLAVGTFDRNLKYWPITVESPDPNFSFKSSFRYSIATASDIGTTYTAFDGLLKTNSLTGAADYTVIRKGAGMYSVDIRAVKIMHKGTGATLARDEGTKTTFMFYTRDPGVRLADGLNSVKAARDVWQIVTVEGGVFQMGALGGEDDQKPVHQVSLSSFLIGKYEVTV
ncbi:MAG: SUMF1/EgtB/PvdO family nonheme iron enzyme, partial [Rectinemataceae bacterium]|nr:SUMF1/EgtB/PvdO family nonheme iron enzyme [Rectinemataceae bacterium]